eukprot:scaffold221870_cov20-Prasinocladus_malaysianus.AAC.1
MKNTSTVPYMPAKQSIECELEALPLCSYGGSANCCPWRGLRIPCHPVLTLPHRDSVNRTRRYSLLTYDTMG